MTDARSNVERVPLSSLRQYLLATGWRRRVPTVRSREGETGLLRARAVPESKTYEVFRAPLKGFEDVEIVVPVFTTSSDAGLLLKSALSTLTELEQRPTSEIVAAISARGVDVIRSRMPDAITLNETVHLAVARNFVMGIRDVLASTATTELEPEPFFLRVKKEGTEFADRCRFGHTFRGSFGFTIESPISPNEEPTFDGVEGPAPFERRVVERFARGLKFISAAAAMQDPSQIVDHAQVGFNANACEQFADLVEQTSTSKLTFDFIFSPEWGHLRPREEYEVGFQHVEVSREAARRLRTQEVPKPATVSGRIVRLQSEADPSDIENALGTREIAVLWSTEPEGDIHVRAVLDPVGYLTAVRAHADGRAVELSGTLEKKGRRWVLSSPSVLKVL
jgi:hypothetical protein